MIFQQEVESLSKRPSKDHVYPRPDLINLDHYLNEIARHRTGTESPNIISAKSGESVMYNFALTTI